jgi:hypothetical protein
VLHSIRANVCIVANRKIGIWVVVPEEGLHLGRLVHDSHDSEIASVVPAPGDAEGRFLLTVLVLWG